MNIVHLQDWSKRSCARALDECRSQIEGDLHSLLQDGFNGPQIEFHFKVGDVLFDEIGFFDCLVRNNIDVSSEIEALYLSYYRHPDRPEELVQPWLNIGIPPLGPAIRAITLLDPTRTSVLRNFLALRDHEHETYVEKVILPDFAKRHGWQNEQTIPDSGPMHVLPATAE